MRRFLAFAASLLFLLPAIALARGDVSVHGYYRRNGTYVQPYHRSAPDHSYNNNWSTSPNVNPYTGQEGTRQPTPNDRPPSSNGYGYDGSQSNSDNSTTAQNPYNPYQQ